jgi:hypothetical protein
LPLKAHQSRIRDFSARKRGLTKIGGWAFVPCLIQPRFSSEFLLEIQSVLVQEERGIPRNDQNGVAEERAKKPDI